MENVDGSHNSFESGPDVSSSRKLDDGALSWYVSTRRLALLISNLLVDCKNKDYGHDDDNNDDEHNADDDNDDDDDDRDEHINTRWNSRREGRKQASGRASEPASDVLTKQCGTELTA